MINALEPILYIQKWLVEVKNNLQFCLEHLKVISQLGLSEKYLYILVPHLQVWFGCMYMVTVWSEVIYIVLPAKITKFQRQGNKRNIRYNLL